MSVEEIIYGFVLDKYCIKFPEIPSKDTINTHYTNLDNYFQKNWGDDLRELNSQMPDQFPELTTTNKKLIDAFKNVLRTLLNKDYKEYKETPIEKAAISLIYEYYKNQLEIDIDGNFDTDVDKIRFLEYFLYEQSIAKSLETGNPGDKWVLTVKTISTEIFKKFPEQNPDTSYVLLKRIFVREMNILLNEHRERVVVKIRENLGIKNQ
jgi:predicted thioredoxin/glutaredoxin